jgi:rare lipoprotein A
LYLSNFGYKEVFAQTEKTFECKATYYHNMFENRRTSSGEIFSQKKYTAAHKTLPLNTLVKVTNLSNGRSVLVKVNDRCPKKGVIDLSLKAAKQILVNKTGVARVKIEVMEDECFEILDEQDEIFASLDKLQLNDSVRNSYFDSILLVRKQKYESAFIFTYYVRLCTIESKDEMSGVKESLPLNYKNIARIEKLFEENSYYVNIGPFLTLKLAEEALGTLKNTYKYAHIVKKKVK